MERFYALQLVLLKTFGQISILSQFIMDVGVKEFFSHQLKIQLLIKEVNYGGMFIPLLIKPKILIRLLPWAKIIQKMFIKVATNMHKKVRIDIFAIIKIILEMLPFGLGVIKTRMVLEKILTSS